MRRKILCKSVTRYILRVADQSVSHGRPNKRVYTGQDSRVVELPNADQKGPGSNLGKLFSDGINKYLSCLSYPMP